MRPLVTVGMPVYNGAKYLRGALTGLIRQDFGDYEVVVCDNCSNDGTAEICEEFAALEPRIRFFRNATNIGLAANHRRVFELARGQFFKWAAYDDEFPAPMLESMVTAFARHPADVAVVYARCDFIDDDGRYSWTGSDPVALDDARPDRRLRRMLAGITVFNCVYGLIRSEALRRTSIHASFPMADHVLCAELAMVGRFVELPDVLLRIRQHPGRTLRANRDLLQLRRVFDPQCRRYALLGPKSRVSWELMRSALRVPDRGVDKLRCCYVAAVVPQVRRLRDVGGLHKRRLINALYRGSKSS